MIASDVDWVTQKDMFIAARALAGMVKQVGERARGKGALERSRTARRRT